MTSAEARLDRIRGAVAPRRHNARTVAAQEVGKRLCYTTLMDGYTPPGGFPAREVTPWTHGGPPVAATDYTPTDDDAREEWS